MMVLEKDIKENIILGVPETVNIIGELAHIISEN